MQKKIVNIVIVGSNLRFLLFQSQNAEAAVAATTPPVVRVGKCTDLFHAFHSSHRRIRHCFCQQEPTDMLKPQSNCCTQYPEFCSQEPHVIAPYCIPRHTPPALVEVQRIVVLIDVNQFGFQTSDFATQRDKIPTSESSESKRSSMRKSDRNYL